MKRGDKEKLYVDQNPDSIVIDGGFKEWDDPSISISGTDTDSLPVEDSHVDITEYKYARHDDSMAFYLLTEDNILNGKKLPVGGARSGTR